jgi:hypothetical protein
VNGALGAGDAMPTGPILTAVTPNGQSLTPDSLDTAVYLKGDRQDSAKLYDMRLIIEYESEDGPPPPSVIGAVQRVDGLTHEAVTVSFQDGASFLNPVVFATPATLNGTDPVTTEFSSIGAGSATLYLEEPDYLDGTHNRAESVTLLTLEAGTWRLADGSLLEVGTTEIPAGPTNAFQSVSFAQAFDEAPVILLQVQTANGPQWEIVRADDVTTTGFQIALQEEEANNIGGSHAAEIVGWAALDVAGDDDVFEWNGIAAQAIDTGATVNHLATPYAFDADLGLDPLVSAVLASFNGADTANLRLGGVSNDGLVATADFLVYEEKSRDAETSHVAEEVTGLAFASAGLLTGSEVFADSLLFG